MYPTAIVGSNLLVFAHFIVATNTVDVPKMRALKQKGKVQDDFLTALKEYAKEKR